MRRAAVILLVLALLIGTAAAFAVTESLKLERRPVRQARFPRVFSPTCACATQAATLAFRLRRADRLDLVIVSHGKPVRTLASDVYRPKGRVKLRWDGRDDAGAIVPDGRYRLSVHFRGAERTIVVPKDIHVDTQPPELDILRVGPKVFSPDSDGRRDDVKIVYTTNETATPLLFVDGRPASEGARRRAGEETIVWNGRLEGRLLRAGAHVLSLRARDRAGNLSPPGASFTARIRYVEVVPQRLVARRGGTLRFRVLTDAASFSWQLRKPHGRILLSRTGREPGTVAARLPRAISRGRYILVATAVGHADRASVRIVKRRR